MTALEHPVRRQMIQMGCIDQGNGVTDRGGDVQLVGREEDAFLFLMGQVRQQCAQLIAVGHVQKRGGFVQQDDGRCLGQGSGNHDALAFTVGHSVQGTGGILLHPDPFEGLHDQLFVFFLHAADPVGVRGPAQGNHVPTGEVGNADALGIDKGDGSGQLLGRDLREGLSLNEDLALVFQGIGTGMGTETTDGTQQGGFPRTVASEQCGELTSTESSMDLSEQIALAITQREVVQGNHKAAGSGNGFVTDDNPDDNRYTQQGGNGVDGQGQPFGEDVAQEQEQRSA